MKLKTSWVIDIDGTISYPDHDKNDSHSRYANSTPNWSVINKINSLYDAGHYIILHTARRMLTHKNDVNAVIADVGAITEKWLADHGVKYHELVFGKPYATMYYVDDKAMNLNDFCEFDEHLKT
jgi:capsule biosynthesis phosphatase